MPPLVFDMKSFRGLPMTTLRVVRCLKYIYAEYDRVGSVLNLRPYEYTAINDAYTAPMLPERSRRLAISRPSVERLVGNFEGMLVDSLHPWAFSSMNTVAYFLYKS